MNKLNLLSKLVVAGAITATGITLVAPQKAEAGTAYGLSVVDYTVGIDITNLTIGGFDTATSDSCQVIDTPGGIDGDIDPIDADQCFVGINPPAQNAFDVFKGQVDPDYSRGDVQITSVSLTEIEAENLAEVYVAHPVSNTPVGDLAESDSQWEFVSDTFVGTEDGSITFSGSLTPFLRSTITGPGFTGGISEAEFEFGININQIADNGDITRVYSFS